MKASFLDDTCDPARKDSINQAIGGALALATIDDKKHYRDDPTFWDLFGKNAIENVTIVMKAFTQVRDRRWNINASCNLNNTHPACTDPNMYGGICKILNEGAGDDSFLYLMFCEGFFALPPLDHRVQMGINHNYALRPRYDLGYFHSNQGRSSMQAVDALTLIKASHYSASHSLPLPPKVRRFTAVYIGSLGIHEA